MFEINLENLKVSQIPGVVQLLCVSSFKQSVTVVFTERQQVKKLNSSDWPDSIISGSGQVDKAERPADYVHLLHNYKVFVVKEIMSTLLMWQQDL